MAEVAPNSFADITERLDEIISVVRSKDTSLERSLDLYDEAIELGSRAAELVDSFDLSPSEAEQLEAANNADEGGARGHIVSLIYKGDHYQYIVRTEENEEDFVFDTEDLWNENDRVSVIVPKDKIRLTLKNTEGTRK